MTYDGPERREYVDSVTCLARQKAIAQTLEMQTKVVETEVRSVHSSLDDMTKSIETPSQAFQQLHDQLLVGNGSEAIKTQVAKNTAFRSAMLTEQNLLKRARRGIWVAVLTTVIAGGFTVWAAVIGRWP